MSVFSALLNNGPLVVGPLADRGTFDQYASYRPGQVVVDGGVVYLNLAAVGAAPVLQDSFDRRDQQGWGDAQTGQRWELLPLSGLATLNRLAAGRGVLGSDADGDNAGFMASVPSLPSGDYDLLARVAFSSAVEDETLGPWIGLGASEDLTTALQAYWQHATGGTPTLQLNAETLVLSDVVTGTVPFTLVQGQDYWLRLRVVGTAAQARSWAVGAPEPETWPASATLSAVLPLGHVILGAGLNDVSDQASYGFVAARALSAATAPADDTDHWVALADALQVAPPL